jgi:hypothetical protein
VSNGYYIRNIVGQSVLVCSPRYYVSGGHCTPLPTAPHGRYTKTALGGPYLACAPGYSASDGRCTHTQANWQPPAVVSYPSMPLPPSCSETGSCYGDISSITGLPKTVYVHGYFRSNGTYVGSYYRSHR